MLSTESSPIVNGIMGSEEKGASCYEPNKEPRVRRGMKGNVIAIVHSVIIFVLFWLQCDFIFPSHSFELKDIN